MNVTEASKVFDIAWGIVKKNKKTINHQSLNLQMVQAGSGDEVLKGDILRYFFGNQIIQITVVQDE